MLKDWLDHDATMRFVNDALLYLTVSRYEGLPLAIVEAMAMGKCIVASKVVGNVDCVRDGYNGRVIDLDAPQFVAALNELLAAPEKIKEYGRNSRKLYEDEFDIRKRIDMLEDIYHEIAGK